MRAETNSLSVWVCHALVAQAPSTTAWSPFLSEEGLRDLAFACAFAVWEVVGVCCGRPMVAPTGYFFVCTFAVYEVGNRLFSGRRRCRPLQVDTLFLCLRARRLCVDMRLFVAI